VVAASRLAAQDVGNPAVADAIAAAIAKQERRERMAARKRKQEEEEAARRHEEEAVVSALEVQLRGLQACDPRMDLLTAVEFITSDPAHRLRSTAVVPLGTGASDQVAWLKTRHVF
jgi:hypothetical protein